MARSSRKNAGEKRRARPRGRPFQPADQPGHHGGRPKGVANKATREAKALCQQLVSDPQYMTRFRRRWRAGKLAPRLEEMVWAYAYGKPQISLEVSGRVTLPDLAALTLEQLRARAQDLAAELRQDDTGGRDPGSPSPRG